MIKKYSVVILLIIFNLTADVQAQASSDLGLTTAFGDAGIKAINFESVITVFFQILLAVAVLWVVYNIVMAGIKIAGAKEDADKRKEGLKSIVNAAIGLVVALSAYAIVNIIANQFLGGLGAPSVIQPCILESGEAGYWVPDPANPQGGSCQSNG